MRDFRVEDAPTLARILALASLTGTADVLAGKGIAFDILEGTYREEEGLFTFKDVRANGSALGLTMSGTYDNDTETVDLTGTLVPAYFFNSLLGHIPLLGEVLIGEEGSGVFAASYTLTGKADDPDISVNPLSALLPGVLRYIFSPPSEPENGTPTPHPRDDPAMQIR